MNKYILSILIIFTTIYSCSKHSVCKDCTIPIGDILLNRDYIEWENVQLGKSYTNFIKIYNPTKKDILLKIRDCSPEFHISKTKNDTSDIIKKGFTLRSLTYDTLFFNFTPHDTLPIGSYFKGIHIETNGEILIEPLKMLANIVGNFDTFENKNLSCRPKIEVINDTFDFGSVLGQDQISASFQIKSSGGKNLILHKIETACGCTTTAIDQNILKPGEITNLHVTFHTIGKMGMQHKTIKLFCNDPQKPVINFTLKGFIKKAQSS